MQEAEPQNIEWVKAIPSLVGTLIGGLITLSALWIKEHFDGRRKVQDWYETTYIDHGVDRLIAYYDMLIAADVTNEHWIREPEGKKAVFPTEAFSRIHMVLGVPFSADLLAVATKFIRPTGEVNLNEPLFRLGIQGLTITKTYFESLREHLLAIRVAKKSDVYLLRSNEAIKQTTDEYQARIDAVHSHIDTIIRTHKKADS